MDYNDFSLSQSLLNVPALPGLVDEIKASAAAHDVQLELTVPERTTLEAGDRALAMGRFFGPAGGHEEAARQCLLPLGASLRG